MNVFEVEPDGPPIATGADALGVIYDERAADADWIAVPVARLDPAFFDLRSGVAGEIAQKAANYRVRIAVVGDVSAHTERSDAFRDFVREAQRGAHLRFVDDVSYLDR